MVKFLWPHPVPNTWGSHALCCQELVVKFFDYTKEKLAVSTEICCMQVVQAHKQKGWLAYPHDGQNIINYYYNKFVRSCLQAHKKEVIISPAYATRKTSNTINCEKGVCVCSTKPGVLSICVTRSIIIIIIKFAEKLVLCKLSWHQKNQLGTLIFFIYFFLCLLCFQQ
jgi:hypothetical protein